ncbi:MAG: LysM peptidoglycan-binding domain-containing protein, partial [Ornithinimicrobium sp.]
PHTGHVSAPVAVGAAPSSTDAETPPAAPTATTTTPAVAAEHEQGDVYEVRPGDTLWSIAEQHLGAGRAYPRIVELNPGRLNRGGDWVTPGMRLRLPTLTAGTGEGAEREVVVREGDTLSALAAEHLGDGNRWPEIYQASTSTVQPDGRRLQDPDVIYPGWRLDLPASATAKDDLQGAPATQHAQTDAEADTGLGPETDTPQDTPSVTSPDPEQPPSTTAAGPARTATESGAASPAGSEHGAPSAQNPPGTANGDAAGDVGGDGRDAARDVEEDDSPAWLLEGIAGSGAMLGGALLLALTLRRRSQFRTRRPGRAVASADPVLAPVEKTIHTQGPQAAVTLEHLDEAMRRLGAAWAATGLPVPAVTAVQLADDGVRLHLLEPADLGAHWQDAGQGQQWFLPAGTPLEQVGPLPADSPAPFPLLVSIGAGDDGSAWLLNLEDLEVALTGAGEYVEDLARYLAAEIAVNPWSAGVRLDCVGIAEEVAPMNPARVRIAGPEAVEDLIAQVVGVIDRVGEGDVPTARARQDGEDTWPARMVLLNTDAAASLAADQVRDLLAHHAGRTGASVVVGGGAPTKTAIQIEATEGGRILIPAAGLHLVGVGLTADEATGCAALLAQSREDPDVPMPSAPRGAPGQEESWRDWTDQAGAIRPEHTVPRHAANAGAVTLLPEDDDAYEEVAATTAADLSALSPRVEPDVAQQVLDADPTLDEDLTAWWDTQARVPRLTLLGPVKAKTWGKPLAERKAYLTELLAYLALHPQGVTTGETAEAFGITEAKTRDYIGRCREWLGQDPASGELHIPHAQDGPAARERGVNVYQVLGLRVDLDLFRRLRTRAAARDGAEGIEDLKQALRLVQGRPFDQLRRGGWGWLFEGDRLDHHTTCAVVDVAHIVATHDLQTGNLAGARAAAEIAYLAAPHEEIPTLDLAAVTAREGRTTEAMRLLQKDVCNRTDDPDLPPGDLPERTQQILDRHGWLEGGKKAV